MRIPPTGAKLLLFCKGLKPPCDPRIFLVVRLRWRGKTRLSFSEFWFVSKEDESQLNSLNTDYHLKYEPFGDNSQLTVGKITANNLSWTENGLFDVVKTRVFHLPIGVVDTTHNKQNYKADGHSKGPVYATKCKLVGFNYRVGFLQE